MSERAIAIAGLVLAALAIVALVLRPRRSRRIVDYGLALGAALLGLAVGLVAAERIRQPPSALPQPAAPPVAPPAPEPTQPSEAQRAAAPSRHIETRLSLEFPIDDEYPTSVEQNNVFDWYAFRNSIRYVPTADEKLGKQQDQLLKLLADVSWNWLIVVIFDQPIEYSQLQVNFAGGQLPYYQIMRRTPRYAVIHVQGRIPSGQMDIATAE